MLHLSELHYFDYYFIFPYLLKSGKIFLRFFAHKFFHFGLKLTGCQKTHCVCIVSPRLFTFFSKVKNTISITDRVKTHGIRHYTESPLKDDEGH